MTNVLKEPHGLRVAQVSKMAPKTVEKRLFIGVRIHASEQPDLQSIQKKLREMGDRARFDIKWSPHANWHVTLKFLGGVANEKIEPITNAMDWLASQTRAFKVRASDISGFPEPRHARVIYAGVSRTQKLLDLQSGLDEIAASLGFASETREYRPHLTIGRLRSAASITDLVSPFVRKKFADFKISELTLFESVLQGNFPIYIPVHTVALSLDDTLQPENDSP